MRSVPKIPYWSQAMGIGMRNKLEILKFIYWEKEKEVIHLN